MAHVRSKYAGLWKPQDLNTDKISSQKMFVENIDMLEEFAINILKRSVSPVLGLSELRAIDTSDTKIYVDGTSIMVKSNGLYIFNRGSTDADNNNTIIAPTTGGGRWISDRIFLTKSDVGLNNVPNVTTNDQTPTYTVSSTLSALTSGEKLSVAFGKIAKVISYLIAHTDNNELKTPTYARLTGFDVKQTGSLNDVRYSGQYGIMNACTDKPSDSFSYGILEVVMYSQDWLVQRYYGITSNGDMHGIYYRTFYSGSTWTPWKRYESTVVNALVEVEVEEA